MSRTNSLSCSDRKKRSYLIVGPPCSGKSSLATKLQDVLAKEGEPSCFLSFDAVLTYRHKQDREISDTFRYNQRQLDDSTQEFFELYNNASEQILTIGELVCSNADLIRNAFSQRRMKRISLILLIARKEILLERNNQRDHKNQVPQERLIAEFNSFRRSDKKLSLLPFSRIIFKNTDEHTLESILVEALQ